MTSFTKSSRSILLWGVLLLSGCGYRAPLHQSYIPQVKDTTLYEGVRSDYQQLAALMEKDTKLKPTCKRYEEIFLSDIKNNCVEVEEAQVKKWSVFRRIRNWMIRVLGGPLG